MNNNIFAVIYCLALAVFSESLVAHDTEVTPEPMTIDEATKAFNWDLEGAEIRTQKVVDGLYVLFGVGGNIAVNIGNDGVLIVDDQFPQLMPKIKDAIAKMGGKEIDFAVTTHWHFDHADGNLTLGQEGTWLVAQENSRAMMQDDHTINLVFAAVEQKAYPESAWPDMTFKDQMKFHINGQQIELMHFGPAHTTGDAAIFFRDSNVVHMGDVFNNSGYPFIDSGNGGQIDGLIAFCQQVLKRINADTIVIPGHGEVTDFQTMEKYVMMLSTVRDRIKQLIDEGASLEDVIAAKPTAEFDEEYGNSQMLIDRAYHSLAHEH